LANDLVIHSYRHLSTHLSTIPHPWYVFYATCATCQTFDLSTGFLNFDSEAQFQED